MRTSIHSSSTLATGRRVLSGKRPNRSPTRTLTSALWLTSSTRFGHLAPTVCSTLSKRRRGLCGNRSNVCFDLKVDTGKHDSVDEKETVVLLKILDDSLAKMSKEERGTLEDEFRKAGVKNPDLSAGKPIAAILAQAGIQVTGFLGYRLAVIVANAVAKAVLGRGLSLVGNAALVRALGVFAGPVGWAVTGLWTAVDLAGPKGLPRDDSGGLSCGLSSAEAAL